MPRYTHAHWKYMVQPVQVNVCSVKERVLQYGTWYLALRDETLLPVFCDALSSVPMTCIFDKGINNCPQYKAPSKWFLKFCQDLFMWQTLESACTCQIFTWPFKSLLRCLRASPVCLSVCLSVYLPGIHKLGERNNKHLLDKQTNNNESFELRHIHRLSPTVTRILFAPLLRSNQKNIFLR